MSKPVKTMIEDSYRKLFGEIDSAVVIDICGVKANDNNTLRNSLAQREIRVTVVKNSLAKRAFNDTPMQPILDLLDGPCAMVTGGQSVVEVARELITQAKTIANLEFRGALMEGMVFGPDEIERLSKFPTREEAQAQAVQIILTPGQKLVGSILGPGRKLASIIKAIEEKLESGEEIKKAG